MRPNMRVRARALLSGLAAVAVMGFGPVPAQAAGRCPSLTASSVEVIRLQSTLGCGKALRAAAVTAVREGFVDANGYYCRWGQGGTRSVIVKGRTYFAGFCRRGSRQSSFLGRELPGRRCDPFTLTDLNGDAVRISDLRVVQTSCAAAGRVARSFHSQTIGSSGATLAVGFGCAYGARGTVTCGSGADGKGPKRISWKPTTQTRWQGRPHSRLPRRCKTCASNGGSYEIRSHEFKWPTISGWASSPRGVAS